MITNYFSPLEFIVSVRKLPNVEFFTQAVNIPSLSITPMEQQTPFRPIQLPGSRISYGDLPISFIIDEGMNNYIEVYNWMNGLAPSEDFSDYSSVYGGKDGLGGPLTDITIIAMNSHKNPNIEFVFKDCFPANLSDIVLDTTQSDVIYPQATVTFIFKNFTINKLT